VRVSRQTSTEAQSHPVGDSSLSGLERKQMRKTTGYFDMREESQPGKGHLVDGQGQFGSCGLVDVDAAALCGVTLHDGEDLQVARGRRQVKVCQPGLFQVVEVSLSQSIPDEEDTCHPTPPPLL